MRFLMMPLKLRNILRRQNIRHKIASASPAGFIYMDKHIYIVNIISLCKIAQSLRYIRLSAFNLRYDNYKFNNYYIFRTVYLIQFSLCFFKCLFHMSSGGKARCHAREKISELKS